MNCKNDGSFTLNPSTSLTFGWYIIKLVYTQNIVKLIMSWLFFHIGFSDFLTNNESWWWVSLMIKESFAE